MSKFKTKNELFLKAEKLDSKIDVAPLTGDIEILESGEVWELLGRKNKAGDDLFFYAYTI